MGLFSFLNPVKSFLGKLFGYAVEAGLTDEIAKAAVGWAKLANEKFVEPADKRAFVIKMLVAKFGIPESVARIAVELAVRAIKKELGNLDKKVGV